MYVPLKQHTKPTLVDSPDKEKAFTLPKLTNGPGGVVREENFPALPAHKHGPAEANLKTKRNNQMKARHRPQQNMKEEESELTQSKESQILKESISNHPVVMDAPIPEDNEGNTFIRLLID